MVVPDLQPHENISLGICGPGFATTQNPGGTGIATTQNHIIKHIYKWYLEQPGFATTQIHIISYKFKGM